MVRLGIIGLSPENGHPYSFSAIINGYNEPEFSKSEWQGILNYLSLKDSADLATLGAKVTHVWTQDRHISQQIAKSCYIPVVVDHPEEMFGNVDALIIARDDYERHFEMAMPFLEKGIPVFIDKPLTLNITELRRFLPFLKSGLLMSCSGFRFAKELDELRCERNLLDGSYFISASVVNGWEKYGIHMIDALLGKKSFNPVSVEHKKFPRFESYYVEMESGELFQINCLGKDVKTFTLSVFGTDGTRTFSIKDNFTAFRRTLFRFIQQVETGEPQVDVKSTLNSIAILISGKKSKELGVPYYAKDLGLDEINC